MNTNIIICDDEPLMINLIQLGLSRKGFIVHGVVNGENLRRRIDEIHPIAIILDLNMIVVQGDEICRYLKNNIKTKGIPVIIFSSDPDGRKRAICAGAEYFVEKREGIEELERVLEEIKINIKA